MQIDLTRRLRELDWEQIRSELNDAGHALTPAVLTKSECEELIGLYSDDKLFRSHIVMARYRFGSGDYKYFSYPLPQLVSELRKGFYPQLAKVANDWNRKLGVEERYPSEHEEFLKQCHAAGQVRPTPLLLHYEAGDYNCLHQDVYGKIAFPLQLTCFLSSKDAYSGGEFVLVEQRPRAQSIARVIAPEQGQVLVFTTRSRPVSGTRGYFRATVRHGVSQIRGGVRYTLGTPFHDAE
jgi:hypothetical protein